MSSERKLGLSLEPHPTIPTMKVLWFDWLDKNKQLKALSSAFESNLDNYEMGDFLYQFSQKLLRQ